MNCQTSQIHFYNYLKDRGQVPPKAASHIENCTECQSQIENLRDRLDCCEAGDDDRKELLRKVLKLHAGLSDRWNYCHQVRPLLPTLLVDSLRVTIPTAVTIHIEQCSQCREDLSRIKSLGLSSDKLMAAAGFLADRQPVSAFTEAQMQALESIAKSDNSGILTRLQTSAAEVAEEVTGHEPTKSYPNQPLAAKPKRPVRYLLTGTIAAAAILMIVGLLPTAVSGVHLKTLYQAVRSVSNVHLQRYSGGGEMIQEIWMSKSLQFKLYRQPQNTFFKDLQTGRIIQSQEGNDPQLVNVNVREEDSYARLLPFDQLKDLPARYDWSYEGDKVLESGQKVLVYALTWDNVNLGHTIQKKWRAYLDTDTHLPYQIDWLERISAEEDFRLITTSVVGYPTETQCRQQVEIEGFQRFLNVDQVE